MSSIVLRPRNLLVALAIVSATMSCGDDDEPSVPNPAAVFCEQQGGRVQIERDDAGNERGICVLADGTRVDEWDYYRTHHPEPD